VAHPAAGRRFRRSGGGFEAQILGIEAAGAAFRTKKRKADAFPRVSRVFVAPCGVSGSGGTGRAFLGSVLVGHRGDLPIPCRGLSAPALLGVVLTFSVSQPDVATRLASRLHLRPFCLATWTLASSAELQPVGIPFRLCTAHGLAFTLEDLSSVSVPVFSAPYDLRGLDSDLLPWDLPPLRRSKLEEFTSRRRLPVPRHHGPAQCRCLVAGFHARFDPPSPFLTTLTGCTSSSPVACFSHSRPWGLGSRLPACLPHFVSPFDNAQQGAGGGHSTGELPVDGGVRSALAGLPSTVPPRSVHTEVWPVRFRLPDSTTRPSRLPGRLRSPSSGLRPTRASRGSLQADPCRGEPRQVDVSGLVSALLPLVSAAPIRRVTAAPGRATGNGPLRTRLRSRPGPLSVS